MDWKSRFFKQRYLIFIYKYRKPLIIQESEIDHQKDGKITTFKEDQPKNSLIIKEEAAEMNRRDQKQMSSQMNEEIEDKKLQLLFEELHRTIKQHQ